MWYTIRHCSPLQRRSDCGGTILSIVPIRESVEYPLPQGGPRPPFAVMRGGMGLQHFTQRLLLEERRHAHRCSRSRGGGYFAASSRGSQVEKPEWLREPRIVFACTLSWRILVS